MPGSIGWDSWACQLKIDTQNPHMLLRTYAPPRNLSLASTLPHHRLKLSIDFIHGIYLLIIPLVYPISLEDSLLDDATSSSHVWTSEETHQGGQQVQLPQGGRHGHYRIYRLALRCQQGRQPVPRQQVSSAATRCGCFALTGAFTGSTRPSVGETSAPRSASAESSKVPPPTATWHASRRQTDDIFRLG